MALQHDDTSLQVAVSHQAPLAQAPNPGVVQASNPLRVWAMNDGSQLAALHAAVQTAVHPGAAVVAAGDGPMLTMMAARCSGVTLVVSLQVGSLGTLVSRCTWARRPLCCCFRMLPALPSHCRACRGPDLVGALGVSCFSMAPLYDISQAPVLSSMMGSSGLPMPIRPSAHTKTALAVQGVDNDCLQA